MLIELPALYEPFAVVDEKLETTGGLFVLIQTVDEE